MTTQQQPLDGDQPTHGDQPWGPVTVDPQLVGSFEELAQQMRRLQRLVSSVRPTTEVVAAAARELAAVSASLEPHVVEEKLQLAGKGAGLPGRSQILIPPLHFDEVGTNPLTGHVTFSRFYLGGGSAAHGGALPLVFDELLGRTAAAGQAPRSRTAYLHVNYRWITPLDRPLRFVARCDRVEGRKIYTTAELMDGDRVVADAEGLFVTLKPGQP